MNAPTFAPMSRTRSVAATCDGISRGVSYSPPPQTRRTSASTFGGQAKTRPRSSVMLMARCYAYRAMLLWADVYRELLAQPAGASLRLSKRELPPPAAAGAESSHGFGPGAHYRFPPDARCRGLHVREERGAYEAHLDRVHPACSLVGHLRSDAPGVFVAGGTAVGAVAGGALGGGRGAAVGSALGFVASMLLAR